MSKAKVKAETVTDEDLDARLRNIASQAVRIHDGDRLKALTSVRRYRDRQQDRTEFDLWDRIARILEQEGEE